ncbi:MAG: hypothetical protein IKK93_06870 [Campylobacter sp.]|nr:hypothetical protein [Campylobacter sp.]
MLQKIEVEKINHKFSDGQEVTLFAPTLGNIRASEKQSDDMSKLVFLLIEMSRGEMNEEFINSLPMSEVTELSNKVAKLMGTNSLKN